MAGRRIYLDYQSATPVLPEVADLMHPWFQEKFGNPSSLHRDGLQAREALAEARRLTAEFVKAGSPEDIIFSSDGAEAANHAIKGTAFANRKRGRHIILSQIEQPALLHSVDFLEEHGFASTRIKVDQDGKVDPEEVRAAIREDTILIALHHANHDVGALQPVAEIGRIANERAITFYVDAESSAGWIPIDVQAFGADLLSFSPHRFYGPKGVGVLYRNRRARLANLIHGGIQEGGRRAGIENVPCIVGAGKAAELAEADLEDRRRRVGELQQRLWEKLRRHINHLRLNGPPPGPERAPHSLNISIEFLEGEGLMLMSDTKGIAFASGTACLSKSLKASHVLEAMGVDRALAQGNILISLGKETTMEDVDQATETLANLVEKLRNMSPMWDEFQRGLVKPKTD